MITIIVTIITIFKKVLLCSLKNIKHSYSIKKTEKKMLGKNMKVNQGRLGSTALIYLSH